MVNYSDPSLNHVFSALADPTRRALLAQLKEGESTVGELARPFGISLPAISKHLRVLESAGLVNRRIAGRVHHCTLNPKPLRAASEWLIHYRQFWEPRLDSLADYLTEHNGEESIPWKPPK